MDLIVGTGTMHSSYEIGEDNIIHATYPGEFTAEEVIKHIEKVLSDPKFRTGMNSIADITNAVFDWKYWDCEYLGLYVKSVEKIRGKCKTAIVVCESGITYAVARIFIVFYESFSPSIEVRLFSNKEEALEWART
jgi:hypothetical protein